jgi:membrane-bound lytic murein transglycosylase B
MDEAVVTHIKKPAEAKPWYEYYQLLVTRDRVRKGLAYWQAHEKTLALAEKKFGVPASVIVAIIGVETNYGENAGAYPVFNTLAILAFNNSRRSDFFRHELTQYLLLTRENSLKPLMLRGSYAGALGLSQFMPSSYRHYAVDFSHKGYADLFHDHADAIGSIGNYLKKHGWQAGEGITIAAKVAGNCSPLFRKSLKPCLREQDLLAYQVIPANPLCGKKTVLIRLQETNGYSHWLGLENFYVISTYNKSELYVMAVNVLAQKIRELKYCHYPKTCAVIPPPLNWQECVEPVEIAL